MSDTRTNAGVDNISSYRKMYSWDVPGERMITIMTAGNLATTQAVIALLDERTKAPQDRDPSILQAPSMFQVARLVGRTLKEVIAQNSEDENNSTFDATMIVGGQIGGSHSRLFMIYSEGNFVEAGSDTPFFQIGETKYGRPIIVRAYDPEMSFEDAVKLLCVSFDSTIKANLSVGLPLDLHVYHEDSLTKGYSRRIETEDSYFNRISNGWGEALSIALASLPDYSMQSAD